MSNNNGPNFLFTGQGVASNAPAPGDDEVISLQKINANLYALVNNGSSGGSSSLPISGVGSGVNAALANATNAAGGMAALDSSGNLPLNGWAINLDNQSIIFDGDSIPYGYNLSTPTTQCYPYLASQMAWAKNHATYHNFAQPSATIQGNSGNSITSRYAGSVQPLRPTANGGSGGVRSILITPVGINDIVNLGSSAATIISQFSAYNTQALSDGFTVFTPTILLRQTLSSAQEQTREAVNTAIREQVIPSSGVIDLEAILPNPLDTVVFQGDGIHPTAQGHINLALYLNAVLTGNAVGPVTNPYYLRGSLFVPAPLQILTGTQTADSVYAIKNGGFFYNYNPGSQWGTAFPDFTLDNGNASASTSISFFSNGTQKNQIGYDSGTTFSNNGAGFVIWSPAGYCAWLTATAMKIPGTLATGGAVSISASSTAFGTNGYVINNSTGQANMDYGFQVGGSYQGSWGYAASFGLVGRCADGTNGITISNSTHVVSCNNGLSVNASGASPGGGPNAAYGLSVNGNAGTGCLMCDDLGNTNDFIFKNLYPGATLGFQFWDHNNTVQFKIETSGISLPTVGTTLALKGGTNATSGTVTLTAGAGTITSTAITTSSVIILTLKTASGANSYPQVTVSAGSATVTGLATDAGIYNWAMLLSNQ